MAHTGYRETQLSWVVKVKSRRARPCTTLDPTSCLICLSSMNKAQCHSSWLDSKDEGCRLALPGLWHPGPWRTRWWDGGPVATLTITGHTQRRHWESQRWAHGLGGPTGRAPGSVGGSPGDRGRQFSHVSMEEETM